MGTHGTYGTNVLARLDVLPLAIGVSCSINARIEDEDDDENEQPTRQQLTQFILLYEQA
jgi:hypothetical protein